MRLGAVLWELNAIVVVGTRSVFRGQRTALWGVDVLKERQQEVEARVAWSSGDKRASGEGEGEEPGHGEVDPAQ